MDIGKYIKPAFTLDAPSAEDIELSRGAQGEYNDPSEGQPNYGFGPVPMLNNSLLAPITPITTTRTETSQFIANPNYVSPHDDMINRMNAARNKELADNAKYRKDALDVDANGNPITDNIAKLYLQQKVENPLIDMWNKGVNKITGHTGQGDDNSAFTMTHGTGEINGMKNEDIDNKDLSLIGKGDSGTTNAGAQAVANSLQDDPNGDGVLYYGKKQDGLDANGQPKYVYKVGFAKNSWDERYKNQFIGDGWTLIKEVKSSGASDAEQAIHALSMKDRTLSYGKVTGADGKETSHDKASKVNFGTGYGELYNKDILGWDKPSTQQDVDTYKQKLVSDAVASGVKGDDLTKIQNYANTITGAQLDKQRYSDATQKSISGQQALDEYKKGKTDSILKAAKAGVTKWGVEFGDAVLDAVTPDGLAKDSFWGSALGSDGHGNSTLLDNAKTDEEINKRVGYDDTSANRAASHLAYDYRNGNYMSMIGGMFSKGALEQTANSFGYMAPMLIQAAGSALLAPETGGGSLEAEAGMLAKLYAKWGAGSAAEATANIKNVSGIVSEVEGTTAEVLNTTKAMDTAHAARDAEAIDTAGNEMVAARTAQTSAIKTGADAIKDAISFSKNAGLYAVAAADANTRIDERIKNNGGQPTSLLENGTVFIATSIEYALDRFVDLEAMGVKGHTQLQDMYKVLDVGQKSNIISKIAAKATHMAMTGGVEGGTEYVQQWMQALDQQYDTKKYGTNLDKIFSDKDNQEQALESFLFGVAMGAQAQGVHAGFSLAQGAVGGAGYRLSGKKAQDDDRVARNALFQSIIGGSVNPTDVGYSTKDSSGLSSDVMQYVVSPNEIPSHIAMKALSDDISTPHSTNSTTGETEYNNLSLNDTVNNMLTSLKSALKGDPDAEDKYIYALKHNVQNSIDNVFKNEKYMAEGKESGVNTQRQYDSVGRIIDAFANAGVKGQQLRFIKAFAANAILENMQDIAHNGRLEDDATIGDKLNAKSEARSQNMTPEEMDALIKVLGKTGHTMGSAPLDGTTGDGGKVSQDGGSVDQTKLTEFIAKLQALKEAGDKKRAEDTSAYNARVQAKDESSSNDDLHLQSTEEKAPSGRTIPIDKDTIKSANDMFNVGAQILYKGMSDKNGAKINGRHGIVTHVSNIVNNIAKLSAPQPEKLNITALNSFISFANNRLIIKRINESSSPKFFDKSHKEDRTGLQYAQGKDTWNKPNFFPQQANKNMFNIKRSEAWHLIDGLNEVKRAINSSNKIRGEERAELISRIDAAIVIQENDLRELDDQYGIEFGGEHRRVMVNIHDVYNREQRNGYKSSLSDSEKRHVEDFKKANTGKNDTHIYTFQDANKGNTSGFHNHNYAHTDEHEEEVNSVAHNNNETEHPIKSKKGTINESTEPRSQTDTNGENEGSKTSEGSETNANDASTNQVGEQHSRAEHESRVKPTRSGSFEQDHNEILSEAEQLIAKTKQDIFNEMQRLVDSHGIEEKAEFDPDASIAKNISAWKKVVTKSIAGLKRDIREQVYNKLSTIDKLAHMITMIVSDNELSDISDTYKRKLDLIGKTQDQYKEERTKVRTNTEARDTVANVSNKITDRDNMSMSKRSKEDPIKLLDKSSKAIIKARAKAIAMRDAMLKIEDPTEKQEAKITYNKYIDKLKELLLAHKTLKEEFDSQYGGKKYENSTSSKTATGAKKKLSSNAQMSKDIADLNYTDDEDQVKKDVQGLFKSSVDPMSKLSKSDIDEMNDIDNSNPERKAKLDQAQKELADAIAAIQLDDKKTSGSVDEKPDEVDPSEGATDVGDTESNTDEDPNENKDDGFEDDMYYNNESISDAEMQELFIGFDELNDDNESDTNAESTESGTVKEQMTKAKNFFFVNTDDAKKELEYMYDKYKALKKKLSKEGCI